MYCLICSCIRDELIFPDLSTAPITEISYTTATSGGDVINLGVAPIIRGVCWSTSENPCTTDLISVEEGGFGTFISNLTNLTPNTTYYVRAFAINVDGTGYGNQVSFTTPQTGLASLTTSELTFITKTSAVSGGIILADNGASVSEKGVCWGKSANPTINGNKTIDGSGNLSFISNLLDLSAGTVYYVRAYATNSIGTSYGNEIVFCTTATIPSLKTSEVTNIGQYSALTGGEVISDGGSAVIERGVCYRTVQIPTITDKKTENGTGTGIFESSLSGLLPSTTYYARAYATNNAGTAYGNIVSFTTQIGIIFNPNLTYGSVIDIDGNTYKTIEIGNQTWIAENLRTSKYSNGDIIGTTTLDISGETSPKYEWAYPGVGSYGRLYTWYAVTDNRNICPTGWHVSSDLEWRILTGITARDSYTFIPYLHLLNSGVSDSGGKLKETGTAHWGSPNRGATNETGFTALPSGYPVQYSYPRGGIWWTSSIVDGYPIYYSLNTDDVYVTRYKGNFNENGKEGHSVRCVKDN